MNNRRKLVIALGAGVLVALPVGGRAQKAEKVWRIGFLSPYSADYDKSVRAALRQGLRDLGYVEGKNIIIEERYADGRRERLHALAVEIVRLPLDVLVAHGEGVAAKQATSTIPIVVVGNPDPVGVGVAASLARPGGNVTGLSDQHGDLAAKRLALLRETIPSASRIAVLWNSATAEHSLQLRDIQAAAPTLRMTVFPLAIKGPEDFAGVFTTIRKERLDAISILGGAAGGAGISQLAELAIQNRIPTIGTGIRSGESGILMSYGADSSDAYRRAATYVDKILRGAKPGDLPIEQPTKFVLTVNLKTAKALGITIPQSVQFRADRVIE